MKVNLSLLKKGCFLNKKTQTSRAKINTSNSNINVDIPKLSKASITEEEDIKCSRKSHVKTENEEMKGISNEEEEIGIRKCRRKIQVDIINEKTKVSSSEEEDIGIRKCRRRNLVDIINEEVKGCTSS